ncbi:hypothetical protein B4589_016530 (plasmid) [Halolamina sp. CBA1230]|uniref:hypothetical protein n=1 Tax=Halolamina sp. CBA1230 TaxID=1853690 RepID=UPI00117B07F2|nr:hypothetical protein [Halolamina sp. CBA1230]QKY22026.1 hypothetical protein B4589_016530 [Halolamina sp. CBA1230]
MSNKILSLGRTFRPDEVVLSVMLVLTALLLVGVSRVLGVITAIKGGYLLLGVGIATLLNFLRVRDRVKISKDVNPPGWLWKSVATLLFGSVALAVVLGSRTFVLLFCYPVILALIAFQLRYKLSVHRILIQVVGLYSLNPLTKYITNGLYFGSGDTFKHARIVEKVVNTGMLAGITNPRYADFPGLHILSASVAEFAKISPYDALILSGIVTYAGVLLPSMYLFSRRLKLKKAEACAVVIALSSLSPMQYYSTYVFPQSIAIPIIALLLLVVFNTGSNRQSSRWTVVGVLSSIFLIILHDFTIILIIPLLILILILEKGANLTILNENHQIINDNYLLVLTICVGAVAYWTLVGKEFIITLTTALVVAIQRYTSSSPTARDASSYWYDIARPTETVLTAFSDLSSWAGIHNTLLIAASILGIAAVIESMRRYRRALPIMLVSVIVLPFSVKLPIVIKSIGRFKHGFGIFFALIVGIGLYRAVEVESKAGLLMALLLITGLGTTGAIISSDDQYSLHEERQIQREFTEREYNELRSVGEFTQKTEVRVDALWLSRLVLKDRHRIFQTNRATLTSTGVNIDTNLLLYRWRWSDHVILNVEDATLASFTKARMSRNTLETTVSRESKIYSSGSLGILYTQDSTVKLSE